MNISVAWINRYLAPPALGADEIERVLTHAGFPVEGREELPGGDVMLDVEITSNRGDALCHVGLARELAASAGKALVLPEAPPADGACDAAGVTVEVPAAECPRFTARVVRGVTVGPSPEWLRTALEAVGQRSINNVVDVTNFVLMELGQPSHVFDLDTLAGNRLIVRHARAGEKLVTLDEQELTLVAEDVVVADAERARSLAGVIGGLDSGVTEKTRDVLIEAATWAPVAVRNTSRRHNIRTDASHRFERVVDPGQIDMAAERIAALIVEVAGGERVPGAVVVGPPLPEAPVVVLRAARCRSVLGIDLDTSAMADLLGGLGFGVAADVPAGTLACAVPPDRRHDVKREIDLIEEVARARGLDAIPVHDTMPVRTAAPQTSERALRALGEAMAGMGFFETVTFSFVTHDEAALFIPPGLRPLAVDENRRKGAPALRPSAVPSLLACRVVNQNGGAEPGSVRLFELSSVYAETDTGETVEHRNLTMLLDAADPQDGVRRARGVIDTLARELGGAGATVGIEPSPPYCAAYHDGAFARVTLEGRTLGCFGAVDPKACAAWPIEPGLVAAELNLDALLALYPPASSAEALPAFPAIERDLSVVVTESTAWARIEAAARSTDPALLDGLSFVGTYRGKPLEKGQKSVTLRLRFRDPARTLRHEEVDPQVAGVVDALKDAVGAELRT